MNQELSSQHQTCPSQIFQRVGVVGAGAMGRGIAQIIAQVGIVTLLH
ncbi:MAG: hypothetical protein EB036_13785, partial [Betaproteobacteria bacterium]|nr:hypothetical protein [Betaproteobacteria bacterium]